MAAVRGPLGVLSQYRSMRLYREGLIRVEQLDIEGCEERFTAALAAARAARSDGMIARSGEQLYMVLRRRRRLDDAVGLAEELVACHRRMYGPDHHSTGAWRNELILLLGHLGRYEQAEPLCRERLASARRAHGHNSLEGGLAGVTLGWCLRQQKRYAEAETACREALASLEAALGPHDEMTGWALGGLADVLARRGEAELAEAALVRARTTWDSVGRTEMATASLERLVDLYIGCERYQEALELSRRRLYRAGRLAVEMAADRERELTNLDRHAFLLRMTGRISEAEAYERRAQVLREDIQRSPRSRDGASAHYDPAGPIFDRQPVLDWGLASPVLARNC